MIHGQNNIKFTKYIERCETLIY